NRALMCDECVAGEFDSVKVHGDRSVPMLLSAMTLPADSVLSSVRATAADEVGRAQRAAPTGAVFDTTEFVNAASEHFITSYQRRAAFLLYQIGTPEAKRSLGIALRVLAPQSPGSLRPVARRFADSLWRLMP